MDRQILQEIVAKKLQGQMATQLSLSILLGALTLPDGCTGLAPRIVRRLHRLRLLYWKIGSGLKSGRDKLS